MSRFWAPRLLLLLAVVADMGALMPLFLLSRRLMPVELASTTFSLALPGVGPSPLILLFVWIGGWAIAARAPEWKGWLTPLLLVAGLVLTWLGLPFWSRAASPLSLIFVLSLLPPLLAAWWAGGRYGSLGVTWASTYDGLRRSITLCLFGLLILQGFPPVGRSVALLGPLLLFTAGLPLLYLTRPGEVDQSKATTLAAVAPVLLVAFGFWLFRSASAAPLLEALLRLGGAVLQVIMILLTPVMEFLYRVIFATRVEQGPDGGPKEKGDWDYSAKYADGRLADWRSNAGPFVAGLVTLLVVALLAFLIWRFTTKRRRPAEAGIEEVRTGPGLLRGLLAELRALLTKEAPEPEEALPEEHPRRLLRRLQAWGALKGRARGLAETPIQYASALRPILPQGAGPESLVALSSAYGEVRYGSGQPNPVQLQSALALLAELEQPGS